jgi:thiol-disulfide isomerase/thioredoxin
MKMKRFSMLLSIVTVFAACLAVADEVAVGSKAPAFSLVNAVDGKTVAFTPAASPASVVVFTCNQCPYAKAFEPRIIEVAKRYQAKGVTFYAIDPNDDSRYAEETMANMKARAVDRGYPFPYLKDGNSAIARAYGARVTPHVFVVDKGGVVRYRGYVDDSAKPEKRTKTGLTDALDSLIAGKPIAETATNAFGCTIKWVSR